MLQTICEAAGAIPLSTSGVCSLFLWISLLYLRCYLNETAPWRPISWRRYTYSEDISAESEKWFNEQITRTVEQRFGKRGAVDEKAPEICVGVTTKVRSNGVDYLPALVGSLFKDLEAQERDRMAFFPFFLDQNYVISSSYQTIAELGLADQIVTPPIDDGTADGHGWKTWYDELDNMPIAQDRMFRKENLDFVYLMDQCLKTRAPYILLLEDDTVARGDWLHQILEGVIPSIEAEAPTNWLYGLLYFSHIHFGWN